MNRLACLTAIALCAFSSAHAGLVGFAPADSPIKLITGDASATLQQQGDHEILNARLEPTQKWAFVRITPAAGTWDLTGYTAVDVSITNNGITGVRPGIRIDQEAEPKLQAWNSAISKEIAPGATGKITVRLGFDYNKPKPINLSKIAAIQIFLGKDRQETALLTVNGIQAIK